MRPQQVAHLAPPVSKHGHSQPREFAADTASASGIIATLIGAMDLEDMDDDEYLSWGEPSSWERLKHAVASDSGRPVSEHLQATYAGLVAFHACRIESLESYQRLGIHPISLEEHHMRAHMVAKEIRPTVLPSDVDHAIRQSPKPLVPAAVYACIDHRELADGRSFSKFGSEHLRNILNRIPSFTVAEVDAYLSGRGTPSIIEFRLPWGELCESARKNVLDYAETTLQEVASGEEHRPAHWTHYQHTPVPWGRVIRIRDVG